MFVQQWEILWMKPQQIIFVLSRICFKIIFFPSRDITFVDSTMGKNIKLVLDPLLKIISVCFFFWQRQLWSLAQLWEELCWLQSLRELFWFWWNVEDLVIEHISCFWQKMTQTTSSRCNHKSDWLIISDTDNIF